LARSLVVTRKIHSHCVLGRGMHANVACWLVGPSRHFAAMQGLVAIDAQRTLANPRPVDLWVHGLIGSGPNTPRRSPDNAETATAVIATVRTRRRVADELALLSLCRVSAGIARITWRMEIAAPELAARSVGSSPPDRRAIRSSASTFDIETVSGSWENGPSRRDASSG
jgi:hypothetical protein